MGYFRKVLVAAMGAATLIGAGSLSAGASESTLIEFDSMTPVTGAAVGAVNDRGIVGGGAPWVITSSTGAVDRQGNLEVTVSGLIIPILTPPHNPLPDFSAAVSCLTPAGVMNVTTALFPATSTGDSTIAATVALPHPCKSPEVFVGFTRNGTFIWFAESNAEGDD